MIERTDQDPGGKKVDVYAEVEVVRAFVFNCSEELNRESILQKIVQILSKIKKSKNKKIRNRDFPVWSGETTNSLGQELFCVAIPDQIAYNVFTKFYETFKEEESYVECGAFLLRDTGGEPIARYSYGTIIIYGDPFAEPNDFSTEILELEETLELRSWQKLESKKQQRIYTKPPKPEHKVDFLCTGDTSSEERHTIDIWYENSELIKNFMTSLKGPCSYKHLKKIIEDYFGIGVFEEPSEEFGRYGYGCIRLGWIEDINKSATVRILINSQIDEKLKLIALAHELSHYVQHFPLLIISQIVEEQAWTMPEIEIYYHHLLINDYPNLMRDVELAAHEFASFFLLPPWMHPITKISEVFIERGRNPEPSFLIWRFLQPFFPDSSTGRLAWTDYNKMEENAEREILRSMRSDPEDGSTLFECILSAALRIEKGEFAHDRLESTILEIYKKVLGLMTSTMSMSLLDARKFIINQVQVGEVKESTHIESDEYLLTLAEFSLSRGSFGREIIPPLEPLDDILIFPRIPLIPASFNPDGDSEGDWQYLPARERSPYGTVEGWRNHKKHYGVILYRFEFWQKEIQKKI